MYNLLPIQIILVPQGAEYQAVYRGLSRINSPKPLILPIPIGCKAVTKHLEKLQKAGHFQNSSHNVLLMGLCGSLSPQYTVGDVVVYRGCIKAAYSAQYCDSELTILLHEKLKDEASLVQGLTSDRIIYSASEKQHLGQLYNIDVVDMEGFAVLEVLKKVAMVRVISDDIQHDLPNLTSTISSEGKLLSLPLTLGMMRQPIAATRLIRGSVQGLRVLENTTRLLFAEKVV